jgi:hypothetical protein
MRSISSKTLRGGRRKMAGGTVRKRWLPDGIFIACMKTHGRQIAGMESFVILGQPKQGD